MLLAQSEVVTKSLMTDRSLSHVDRSMCDFRNGFGSSSSYQGITATWYNKSTLSCHHSLACSTSILELLGSSATFSSMNVIDKHKTLVVQASLVYSIVEFGISSLIGKDNGSNGVDIYFTLHVWYLLFV